VSAFLRERGERACLFTDQANPTSNKIYEALGYERLVDMANMNVK
jgi:predicted GNAT family acetyltransferase